MSEKICNALSPSAFVNQERLWRRHMEMAKIGETNLGGVNRQALSPEDARAQLLMIAWGTARKFACYTDTVGNLFIRREGLVPNVPPVVAGSHLDSQPNGGKFDGASGVLTAFEALEAICDQNVVTKRPIEVVSWINEEGSRFELGCMGSNAFSDPTKLAMLLAQKDASGMTAAAALAEVRKMLPSLPERPLGFPIHSFLELHIEQGRRLEIEQKTIGIVTEIQGSRKFIIEVIGEDAHSATTPASARKDALFAAVDIVAALRKLMQDPAEDIRFTIGRFEVLPGSLNVVPSRVVFTIDLRHPVESVLTALGDQIEPLCKANAGACSIVFTDLKRNPVQKFEGQIVSEIEAAVEKLGLSSLYLRSFAGHDARYIANICPTGMIFVPCENGISHNERENAKPEDLAAGARVLAEVLVQLANR